jgi:hypothetical protein
LLIELIEVVHCGADLPNHPNVVADGGLPAERITSASIMKNKITVCMQLYLRKKRRVSGK